MKRRILIIEDEKPILEGLIDLFTYHGYEALGAGDGRSGLDLALREKFDIIILDVMLPELDGFAVCNAIRAQDRTTPILMLTAKTAEEDLVTGLSLGADDYVAKPFSIRALVLRVEAILRRTLGDCDEQRFLRIGESLLIDTANLVGTFCAGHSGSAEFTRREVEILCYLQQHHDRPVSRAELLEQIWGYQRAGAIETRTVDIHIAKLRKKIEPDAKCPNYLATIRGEGYRLLHCSFQRGNT